MPLFHLLLVSVVQGATEFLPVSSSGHLLLVPSLAGSEDQGQMIDIAAHVGTLGAVVIYFRRDVLEIAAGCLDMLRGKFGSAGARLAFCLVTATVPVMAFGLALHVSGLSDMLRNVGVVGAMTLAFAIVLLAADRFGATGRRMRDWTPRQAVVLGLWQALALVPGTSRAGVVISGARLLGFGRREAARISLLMSIPTIAAAGSLAAVDSVLLADMALLRDGALVALVSMAVALLSIHLLLLLLRRVSYTPFVVYRIVLGCGLMAVAWG
ncbi:MAG: undecaprenyl-diphosphate phosphatase [Rhodobacteraceae bacterium]|nr:undecaprenyl-diphosphate phosphatase [Paracoccaceae bacterium]